MTNGKGSQRNYDKICLGLFLFLIVLTFYSTFTQLLQSSILCTALDLALINLRLGQRKENDEYFNSINL